MVDLWVGTQELVARFGSFGTLAAELDHRHDGLDRGATEPISLLVVRAEEQFRQMGRLDAHDLAINFVVGVQGAALHPNACAIRTL